MTSSTFTFNTDLYGTWKDSTGSVFTENQDKEVIQWLTTSAIALSARRKTSNDIIVEMKACIEEGGTNAESKAGELFEKGEKCLEAGQEERKRAQREFDKILTPVQRLRIVVHAVERANDKIKATDVHACILADACGI